MTRKLKAMPYAQAHITINDGTIELWSYTTKVATIIDGLLKVNGLYSATTRKHISAFVREYANTNYQIAKKCYEMGKLYNIRTNQFED